MRLFRVAETDSHFYFKTLWKIKYSVVMFFPITFLSDPSALLYSIFGFFFSIFFREIQTKMGAFSLTLSEDLDSTPSDG